MRFAAFILALTVAVTLAASAAQAQTMKKGALDGTIVTRSVFVPLNTAVDVFVTPTAASKGGFFVMTQVCVTNRNRLLLSGNTMGDIVLDNDCQTFSPGLAVPAGETLTFTEQNNGDHSGMITGILTKK